MLGALVSGIVFFIVNIPKKPGDGKRKSIYHFSERPVNRFAGRERFLLPRGSGGRPLRKMVVGAAMRISE